MSKPQCKEMVYRRDTYRRTGRTPSGFEMHYDRGQCTRPAGPDGYCYQHPYGKAYKTREGWRKMP